MLQLTDCPDAEGREWQCDSSPPPCLLGEQQQEDEHGVRMSTVPRCLSAFACRPSPRAPLGSCGTSLLGASVGIRVSSFQGTGTQLCPDSRSFHTIKAS